MKYDEMQAILRRLDEAVGGHWFVVNEAGQHPAIVDLSDGVSPFLAHYRPVKYPNESAPGLSIATTANTELIARLSGFMMDVRANADFIVHAREDMRLLVTEIVRLNGMLVALGKEAPEAYGKVLDESGGSGNWAAQLESGENPA